MEGERERDSRQEGCHIDTSEALLPPSQPPSASRWQRRGAFAGAAGCGRRQAGGLCPVPGARVRGAAAAGAACGRAAAAPARGPPLFYEQRGGGAAAGDARRSIFHGCL